MNTTGTPGKTLNQTSNSTFVNFQSQIDDRNWSVQSKERIKKEISLLRARYDFEIVSRQSEEITARRALVRDLRQNFPQVEGVGFDDLMNLGLE